MSAVPFSEGDAHLSHNHEQAPKKRGVPPVGLKNPLDRIKTSSHKDARSNSTSTLYVQDTLTSPDLAVLLSCIGKVLHQKILASASDDQGLSPIGKSKGTGEIFNEKYYPISYDREYHIPTETQVVDFIDTVFEYQEMGPECAIMALAYVDRLQEKANITMSRYTWRRILLSVLILSSKVWEDLAVWNADFIELFPYLSVRDLAELEKELLHFVQYNVTLKASEYAQYFFELHALTPSEHQFPLKPLNKSQAARLEDRSAKAEADVRDRASWRSKSLTQQPLKSPRAVLN